MIVTRGANEAMALANRFAPEHLVVDREALARRPLTAGAVFIGPYSAQAAGDYATGSNHVLPTAGAARFRGGLSAADFVRVMSVQRITREGLARLAPTILPLARAEGLEAHAESIEVRLDVRLDEFVVFVVVVRRHVIVMSHYQKPPELYEGLRLHQNENTGGCSPRVIEALARLRPDQIGFYPPYAAATERGRQRISACRPSGSRWSTVSTRESWRSRSRTCAPPSADRSSRPSSPSRRSRSSASIRRSPAASSCR